MVSVTPGTPGTADITLRVTGADGQTGETTVGYGLTAASSTGTTTRWHSGAADASTALDVGGGYMLVANDENNPLRLYRRDASGPPLKSWSFDAQMHIGEEVDLEAATRVGNTIYWIGSLGNNKSGKQRPVRQQVFTTQVSGTGADVQLSFGGYFRDLRNDLVAWDEEHENRLGLADATGGIAKRIGGFNVEGLVFAPGSSSTAYLGFRAPLQPAEADGKALIVPVTNMDELPQPDGVSSDEEGNRTVTAEFGEPILMDLGGLSIREIRKNASDEYLIVAGLYQAGGSYALYKWDGVPGHPPLKLRTVLPATDAFGEDPGAWEGIVNVPDPLVEGADVQMVMDNGSTDFFGNGQEAKGLPAPLQKSRGDHFTLHLPVAPVTAPTGVVAATGAGGGEIELSWTAPSDDGSSPVTGYRIVSRVDGVEQGVFTTADATTHLAVTGLGNGTTYTFTAGTLPLEITQVRVEGEAEDDFLVTSDRCSGETIAAEATCTVRLRFAPSTPGARTATLVAPPASAHVPPVALAGVGGDLPQGPTGPTGPTGETGATGASGATGATGASGATGPTGVGATGPSGPNGPIGGAGAQGPGGQPGLGGPAGATGPAGARGPAGRDGTVTCRVRGKKSKQVTCSIERGNDRSARARLVRDGRVYARGPLGRLEAVREIPAGVYQLRIGSQPRSEAITVRVR